MAGTHFHFHQQIFSGNKFRKYPGKSSFPRSRSIQHCPVNSGGTLVFIAPPILRLARLQKKLFHGSAFLPQNPQAGQAPDYSIFHKLMIIIIPDGKDQGVTVFNLCLRGFQSLRLQSFYRRSSIVAHDFPPFPIPVIFPVILPLPVLASASVLIYPFYNISVIIYDTVLCVKYTINHSLAIIILHHITAFCPDFLLNRAKGKKNLQDTVFPLALLPFVIYPEIISFSPGQLLGKILRLLLHSRAEIFSVHVLCQCLPLPGSSGVGHLVLGSHKQSLGGFIHLR